MSFQGPIFICGTSRSGTCVVHAALDRHARVRIAGETHYFDDLRVTLGKEACRRPLRTDRKRQVEDHFLALTHRPYGQQGNPDLGWMDRESLRARAESLGGSADDHFEAFGREWAARHAADIWGERTPRHVFRLEEMLSLFPSGKAIFMLRDPRAVVASYRDWRNQGGFDLRRDPGQAATLASDELRARRSYHPVTISLLWVAAFRAAHTAQDRFGPGRVHLQRYESLCERPKEELGRLFRWLGLDTPAEVDRVPVLNSSYERYAESKGFLRSPIDRWRSRLSPPEITLVERCCGRSLERAGYASATPSASLRSTLPYCISALPAIFRAATANAGRSGHLPTYLLRRMRLLLGS